MGWWFGRKDAPADARPFVPSWLSAELANAGGGEGFARSYFEQFEEVYRRNPVGQRSVRLVAGLLGGLTIDVLGDERAGDSSGRTDCSRGLRRTCCCTAMPTCNC